MFPPEETVWPTDLQKAAACVQRWVPYPNVCGSKPVVPFGVGEFTTHFLVFILVGIGMFTGGTIWLLTHGQMSHFRPPARPLASPHSERTLRSGELSSEVLQPEPKRLKMSNPFLDAFKRTPRGNPPTQRGPQLQERPSCCIRLAISEVPQSFSALDAALVESATTLNARVCPTATGLPLAPHCFPPLGKALRQRGPAQRGTWPVRDRKRGLGATTCSARRKLQQSTHVLAKTNLVAAPEGSLYKSKFEYPQLLSSYVWVCLSYGCPWCVLFKGVRIYFGIFFRLFFGFFFRFSSGPAKCCILQHFLIYTSSSTSPASFSTSPACPTNIPSITNKSWVTKSKNVAGGLTGSKQ